MGSHIFRIWRGEGGGGVGHKIRVGRDLKVGRFLLHLVQQICQIISERRS